MITYYVIKHLPSGQYFPQKPGTGSSHVVMPLFRKVPWTPRLFTQAHVAKAWLTTYCKGPMMPKYVTVDRFGSQERDGYTHDISHARNPADFKVQKIEMSFKEIM